MAFTIPKVEIYTRDKTSPRSFRWQWFLRLTAILFTLIVLGFSAVGASEFSSSGCNAPSKLNYNLAVSVLSFLALIYFILATGPTPQTRLLPWLIYGQLALDFLLCILWLAAAASSRYNCNDLCNACSDYSEVYYDDLLCFCFDSFIKRRDYSPAPTGLLRGRAPRSQPSSHTHLGGSDGNSATTSGDAAAGARQAFDAIVTVNFLICLAADLFWIFKASRSSRTTTITSPDSVATGPVKYEEAGMAAPAAQMNNNQHQGANAEYYTGQSAVQQEQQQRGYQQQQPMVQGQTQAVPQQQQTYPVSEQQQRDISQQHEGYLEPKEGTTEVPSPGGMKEGGGPMMVPK